jgi:hypothetical protein
MAFTDPNPQVSQVSSSTLKKVTAVGQNANSTDAGDCFAWWEVELTTDINTVVIRANKSFPNDYSVIRSRTDIFSVPLGQNWDGKRVRFVIQSSSDPTQVWYSAWAALTGEGFNNDEDAPAPTTTTTAAVAQSTLQAQQLRKVKAEQDRKRRVRVSTRSRYKMSKAYIDSEKSGLFANRGVVFGPMALMEDFYSLGDDYFAYRVGGKDIGFLDLVARSFFGEGNEDLWWTIAYANAVIDPETDLISGDVIAIPAPELTTKFLLRSPTPTNTKVN